MWAKIVLALALLPGLTLGVRHHVDVSLGSNQNSKALSFCNDEDIINSGCDQLFMIDQLEGELDEQPTDDVSVDTLEDYFMAEPQTIDNFWSAMGFKDASTSCKALCEAVVTHIAENMDVLLPETPNKFCRIPENKAEKPENCEYTEVSADAMEHFSHDFDPSRTEDALVESVEHEHGHDYLVQKVTISEEEKEKLNKPDFSYGVDELALRVAYIFSIFPLQKEKDDTSGGGSLVDVDEEPTFGPAVLEARKKIWKSTVMQSEQWVNAAIGKLAGSKNVVQAWFGNRPDADKEARKILLGMAKTLANTKVRVGEIEPAGPCGPDGTGGTLAYVTTWADEDGNFLRGTMEDDKYVIRFCESFWKKDHQKDPATKYGTVVHESSHHHGTDDVAYDGNSPYGLVNCLWMAAKASPKALNNADNYMFLVYYLNRCGSAETPMKQDSPCSVTLKQVEKTEYVDIIAECSKPVHALWIQYIMKSGSDEAFSSKPNKFGDLPEGSFILKKGVLLPPGTYVQMIFEFDCVLWQTDVMWNGKGPGKKVPDVSGDAEVLHVMTPGGVLQPAPTPTPAPRTFVPRPRPLPQPRPRPRPSPTPSPTPFPTPFPPPRPRWTPAPRPAPTPRAPAFDRRRRPIFPGRPAHPKPAPAPKPAPSGSLPCRLTATRARLAGGKAGFTLMAKCTENVFNLQLHFKGPRSFSKQYEPQRIRALWADETTRIFTHEIATFYKYVIYLSDRDQTMRLGIEVNYF